MHLKPTRNHEIHLSWFFQNLSAYEMTSSNIALLEDQIKDAVKKAKATKEAVIVEQDSLEHIFVVWPSGNISLYRECGNYEIIWA